MSLYHEFLTTYLSFTAAFKQAQAGNVFILNNIRQYLYTKDKFK